MMGVPKGVKKNVAALGAASFLTDVSSEMVFPLLPVFLASFLGAGKEIIGLIEGIADSAASLLDIFSGHLSDKGGSRKRFVMAGYGLSTLSKLGIALSVAWPSVLVFRGVERMGKSIRTAPRDAIIAESSARGARGAAFGLHRAMDTAGAVVGPAIAFAILALLGSGEAGYRAVFLSALAPAFLAVLVIWAIVKEPSARRPKPAGAKAPGFWQKLRTLPDGFTSYLKISCLFSLAYFSFALLILRASEEGIPAESILVLYIIYNISYMLLSVPMGRLSDIVGRKNVIGASFIFYGAVCVGFALAGSVGEFALLFALYGAFVAADESVNKAYISGMIGKGSRGMALGAYSTAVGAAYLPASVAFGFLWSAFGAMAAFGAAASVAVVSGAMMLARKEKE